MGRVDAACLYIMGINPFFFFLFPFSTYFRFISKIMQTNLIMSTSSTLLFPSPPFPVELLKRRER